MTTTDTSIGEALDGIVRQLGAHGEASFESIGAAFRGLVVDLVCDARPPATLDPGPAWTAPAAPVAPTVPEAGPVQADTIARLLAASPGDEPADD